MWMLSGFHRLTRCGQTEKFCGFTKLACWKTLMQNDMEIIKAVQCLGDLKTDLEEKSVVYVMQLYCKTRPSHVNDLSSLRWFLFSQYQLESHQHILHFIKRFSEHRVLLMIGSRLIVITRSSRFP